MASVLRDEVTRVPGMPQAVLQQLTKAAFQAQSITLCVDWHQPQGAAAQQYADAFAPSERFALANPAALFRSASSNKYHVDQARVIGDKFAAFLDAMCAAICQGHELWRAQAHFSGVQIMAVNAIGAPGCLQGPDLAPLILATAPQTTPQEAKYAQAISSAIAGQWQRWQDNVTVPGLPWYPTFAAFPGPQAPPTPNVPTPLAACPSALQAEMSAPRLKQAMVDALADPDALHHAALFDALAQGLAASFLTWLAVQQVTLVLGKGPIPTFAPPYVPVGPVMGGDILALPGHLAA